MIQNRIFDLHIVKVNYEIITKILENREINEYFENIVNIWKRNWKHYKFIVSKKSAQNKKKNFEYEVD